MLTWTKNAEQIIVTPKARVCFLVFIFEHRTDIMQIFKLLE